MSISKRHFWNFFYKIYIRAFTQQNIRTGWAATEIYLLNSEYVFVRIPKRKKKSEVTSLLKISNSDRAFRRTFGRLQTKDYIDKETAILARGGKKFKLKIRFSAEKLKTYENMQPRWKKQNLNKNVLQQIERCSRPLHAKRRLEKQQKRKPERKLNG
jgi:hypothetical protein